jgi:hypothetical protein
MDAQNMLSAASRHEPNEPRVRTCPPRRQPGTTIGTSTGKVMRSGLKTLDS